MPRLARVIAAGLPHHVTQRGNGRRCVFESVADRLTYLQLLDSQFEFYGVAVVGYCLMSNHVHLVLVPRQAGTLGLALRNCHGRYAAYFNARHGTCGHLWQGRYYSCPLDIAHLWSALRYTECNPVRAGMSEAPDGYGWSSAALHCGCATKALPVRVDMELWESAWNVCTWREFLAQDNGEEAKRLRVNTHTGRPLGSPEFVKELERTLQRTLAPRRGGRPRKQDDDSVQAALRCS